MRRIFAFLLMAMVMGSAGAFACTNISTLNISDSTGRPGDRVLVTGTSFGNSSPTGRRTSTPLPVRVRWNAVEGPTLAELAPDPAGNISASITIPDASPDRYVIFAVQQDADGYHMYGTPARIAYEVLTPDGRSAPPSEAVAVSSSAGGSAASLPTALVALGGLGGALFVVGFVSFARLFRPGEPSAVSRVRSS